MIIDNQLKNMRNLSIQYKILLFDELIEDLVVVTVATYAKIMCENKRTSDRKAAKCKLTSKDIDGIIYILINC